MTKITIIGGGAFVFPLVIARDLLSFESLRESLERLGQDMMVEISLAES